MDPRHRQIGVFTHGMFNILARNGMGIRKVDPVVIWDDVYVK